MIEKKNTKIQCDILLQIKMRPIENKYICLAVLNLCQPSADRCT